MSPVSGWREEGRGEVKGEVRGRGGREGVGDW